MSWTGSEGQRRAQGTCRPPATPEEPRYRIPAGTPCQVRKLCGRRPWRTHETKKELTAENAYDRRAGYLEFRIGEWAIRVLIRQVVQRDLLVQQGLFNRGQTLDSRPREREGQRAASGERD
jgi:hypothetical protein